VRWAAPVATCRFLLLTIGLCCLFLVTTKWAVGTAADPQSTGGTGTLGCTDHGVSVPLCLLCRRALQGLQPSSGAQLCWPVISSSQHVQVLGHVTPAAAWLHDGSAVYEQASQCTTKLQPPAAVKQHGARPPPPGVGRTSQQHSRREQQDGALPGTGSPMQPGHALCIMLVADCSG
jgi:hypothetical protein